MRPNYGVRTKIALSGVIKSILLECNENLALCFVTPVHRFVTLRGCEGRTDPAPQSSFRQRPAPDQLERQHPADGDALPYQQRQAGAAEEIALEQFTRMN
jgi:hypothetical protein